MKKSIIFTIAAILFIVGGYYLAVKKPSAKTANTNQDVQASYGYQMNQAPPAPVSPPPAMNSTTLSTKTDSNLGAYLVASNGMTLYKYTPDTPGVSNCSGQCAANWPPYTVSDSSALKVDPQIKGTASTIKRADGTMQVTYNGMPLYFWVKDAKPGDTTGQNVGGVWFVVSP